MPAVAADQRQRFEELIVPQMPFLARIARSMSRSAAEAEDLAQDTLVKAFRAMDGFDGRHPKAWLARIARNTAINRDQRNREFLSEEGTSSSWGPRWTSSCAGRWTSFHRPSVWSFNSWTSRT